MDFIISNSKLILVYDVRNNRAFHDLPQVIYLGQHCGEEQFQCLFLFGSSSYNTFRICPNQEFLNFS